jgi:hypothetical protein
MKRVVLAALLAACGGSSSSSNGTDGNNGNTADSPPAASMVKLSGVAQSKGTSTSPLAGVALAAYSNSAPTTPVAMTTSAADGTWELDITTNGTALDGFLKATISGYVDTYLYPPIPVAADYSGLTVFMVTPSTYDLLANTLCSGNQLTTNGAIAVEVLDASAMAVAGAKVASSPAATKYCYNQGGFPNKSATMTDTDGIGYMLNVTGDATVSATKSGTTFHSHAVNARAGALTLTIIQP